MRAQRARCRKAVESYEGERPVMDLAIGADEISGHESHVSMESVPIADAGGEISSCPGQIKIRLADEAVEIEDRRRIAAIRLNGAFVIGAGGRAICVAGEEEVKVATTTRERFGGRIGVRDVVRLWTLAVFVVPLVILVVRSRCRPKAGAQGDASCSG